MKKTLVITLHFGYWLLYLLLLAVVFAMIMIQLRKELHFPSYFPLIVLSFLPNLFAFYSSYFFLFSSFLRRRKFFALFVFGTINSALTALFCAVLSTVFYGFGQRIFTEKTTFTIFFVNMSVIAAIHGVIALIIRGFVTWFEEIKLKEDLAKKNYETEVALIKSQINPHFLFNTINNIDVLIAKDPAKASSYLNQLSDILRYMVYDTKKEKISLQKELDYIKKYLELQKIRTVNPNYVDIRIEGEPNNSQIAAMIFFPFIENAFKHTENDKKINSINISFRISENSLNFECKNTYQKASKIEKDYGGIGNELIRKRLNLLYPEKHSLEINENGAIYQVKLFLELDGN